MLHMSPLFQSIGFLYSDYFPWRRNLLQSVLQNSPCLRASTISTRYDCYHVWRGEGWMSTMRWKGTLDEMPINLLIVYDYISFATTWYLWFPVIKFLRCLRLKRWIPREDYTTRNAFLALNVNHKLDILTQSKGQMTR